VPVVDIKMNAAAQGRLNRYFDEIGDILEYPARRELFGRYAVGLLSEGERKSIEPIAVRACADPKRADAEHQRMLHFITDSPWDDHVLRRHAARYALAQMTERCFVQSWIIDDTGFLKQGKHSVGVQRQYTGSAGKVTNCQIGVSLTLATPHDHLPVDFELYLPTCWADDPERRREARIPDDVRFKTKPELALDMLRRAVKADLPRGTVLADEAYGNSSAFREGCRKLGLDFAAAINTNTKVWLADALGRRHGDPIDVATLGRRLVGKAKFRAITWREGSDAPLRAKFAVVRVVPVHDDGHEPARRDRLWLVCEWRDGDEAACHFHFATYRRMPFRDLARIIKERWRTERVYQDFKGEFGLDHFEGRRWRGWHHHVTVALCCFAFVAAERARRFPPSAVGPEVHDPLQLAA
jgi:SRSO17 transposase